MFRITILTLLCTIVVLQTSGICLAQISSEPTPNYAHVHDMHNLLHWQKMPVHVYFNPGPMNTKDTRTAILAGFDEWVRASHETILYTVVYSPLQADLTIKIDDSDTLPGTTSGCGNTAESYIHNVLQHTSMELAAGSKTNSDELQETAAHEFGHALGIEGHSDNSDDLMYPIEMRIVDPEGNTIPQPPRTVTTRDLNTLKVCYKRLFAHAPPQ